MFSSFPKCLLAALLVLAYSCGSPKIDSYGELFRSVIKSDSGIFRSIDLGMNGPKVKAKEEASPAEEDDYYLYYDMSSDDTTDSYSLAYSFDSTGLSSIEADVYPATDASAAALLGSFQKYFTEKYGKGTSDKGFLTWHTTSGGKKAAISITDESESTDAPLVSISIYQSD